MPEPPHLIKLPGEGSKLTILLLFVNLLVFTGNLYISNGYVSKNTYEADAKDTMLRRESLNAELRNIAIELKGIKEHMLGDERQDKRIDDLETRLREQEKKR